MSAVQAGDTVRIHYTGRLAEGGEVFDSSREREPLEFVAGSDKLIPGVSKAVIGMAPGESKKVSVAPEEGYGAHDPRLEQQVPRSALPDEAKVGDQLVAMTADEQRIPVVVRELGDDIARLDANHPLAGQTLEFELEVVEVVAG